MSLDTKSTLGETKDLFAPKYPPLVAIHGYKSVGKSYVARVLINEFSYKRIAFADPLKDMVRAFLPHLDIDPADVEDIVSGSMKSFHLPILNVTSRWLQQSLGTEWGRYLIHPDIWVEIWKYKVRRAIERGERIVTDDLRFPNEDKAVDHINNIWCGRKILILRPGHDRPSYNWFQRYILHKKFHPSDREIPNFHPDYVLHNDATEFQLFGKIFDMMNTFDLEART